jgi:phosphoglycerate dehydrogenase-like enzyme
MKSKLLVLDDWEGALSGAPAMAKLRELVHVDCLHRPLQPADRERLCEYRFLLALRERTPIDCELIAAASQLELILQTGGHAYHVDLEAATRHGVVTALGRGVSSPSKAIPELVFALLLGIKRGIYTHNARMSAGEWSPCIGESLAGKTMGILGYGRLGRPVARLAEAFGMRVLSWDRTGEGPTSDTFGVARLPLDTVLKSSDVLSIHLRVSSESRGLIDERRLNQLKPGAILINTSRGAIVDELALVNALEQGRLSGAGLDVYGVEPLPETSPLRKLPNVLLTPHIGWQTRSVFHEFVSIAAEQLDAWLGKRLSSESILNVEALKVQRDRIGAAL